MPKVANAFCQATFSRILGERGLSQELSAERLEKPFRVQAKRIVAALEDHVGRHLMLPLDQFLLRFLKPPGYVPGELAGKLAQDLEALAAFLGAGRPAFDPGRLLSRQIAHLTVSQGVCGKMTLGVVAEIAHFAG